MIPSDLTAQEALEGIHDYLDSFPSVDDLPTAAQVAEARMRGDTLIGSSFRLQEAVEAILEEVLLEKLRRTVDILAQCIPDNPILARLLGLLLGSLLGLLFVGLERIL